MEKVSEFRWKKVETYDFGRTEKLNPIKSILWKNEILVFNESSICSFNLKNSSWTKIIPIESSELITNISEISLCSSDDEIILFGNKLMEKLRKAIETKSLFAPDYLQYELKSIDLTELSPFLKFHTSNIHGNMMYVFGGKDDNNSPSDQLWIYLFG